MDLISNFNSIAEGITGVHKSLKDNLKFPTLRRFITEHMGYPLEKHIYTTKDGHINTVYRIPGKRG